LNNRYDKRTLNLLFRYSQFKNEVFKIWRKDNSFEVLDKVFFPWKLEGFGFKKKGKSPVKSACCYKGNTI